MSGYRFQTFGLSILLMISAMPATNAVALPTSATVVHCTDALSCPDLGAGVIQPKIQNQSFTANSCAVIEGEIDLSSGTTRKLLRFSSLTPNTGPGPLFLGDPAEGPNADFYVFAPCHGHYHFRDYAAYRLWKPADYTTWQNRRANPQFQNIPSSFLIQGKDEKGNDHYSQIGNPLNPVTGHKQGFCAIDVTNIPKFQDGAKRTYTICGTMTTPGNQGISVGWADEYTFDLDGQWVDITLVPPGSYILEVESNPGWLIEETNYLDNSATVSVIIK